MVQYNRGREKQTFSYRMEEHMDTLSGTIDRSEVVYPMPKIILLSDEVRVALGKVKTGKQPGPDGIKGEIYRYLQDSERLVAKLTGAMVEHLDRNWLFSDYQAVFTGGRRL